MSKNKTKIIEALIKAGFTENFRKFKLFYWAKDGWYVHCDQLWHDWVGQNTRHVLETINKGELNRFLKEENNNE